MVRCMVSDLGKAGRAKLARELAARRMLVDEAERVLAAMPEPSGEQRMLDRRVEREALLAAAFSGFSFCVEEVVRAEGVAVVAAEVEEERGAASGGTASGAAAGAGAPPDGEEVGVDPLKPHGGGACMAEGKNESPHAGACAAPMRIDAMRITPPQPTGGRVVRVERPVPAIQPKLEGLGMRPDPGGSGDYVLRVGPPGDAEAGETLAMLRERRVYFTVQPEGA